MTTRYHPRRFDQSPLFQVVYHHFDHSVAVPFSCKTRLFCPSCHDLKTLLWIEAIQGDLLLPVAHRFWTFSIPKRLRYYCLRNRKLLSLIVSAAVNTLASWRHSGFHVHASSPFMPSDGELLRTRLAYAFRPPVALGRMDYELHGSKLPRFSLRG